MTSTLISGYTGSGKSYYLSFLAAIRLNKNEDVTVFSLENPQMQNIILAMKGLLKRKPAYQMLSFPEFFYHYRKIAIEYNMFKQLVLEAKKEELEWGTNLFFFYGINDIESLIKYMNDNPGRHVFVDYAELLSTTKQYDSPEYSKIMQDIYRRLVSAALDHNTHLYTAYQLDRRAQEYALLNEGKIGPHHYRYDVEKLFSVIHNVCKNDDGSFSVQTIKDRFNAVT